MWILHCRAKELETWFYLVIELSQFDCLYVLETTFWRTQYAEYGKTQQHFTCVKTNLRCNMYSKKGNNCTHAILWRQIKNLYTLVYMAMGDKYPIHTSNTCLVELCVTEWNQKQKTNAFPWVLTRRIFWTIKELLRLTIISFILVILTHEPAVMLEGKTRCWSLLQFKGLLVVFDLIIIEIF